MFATGLFLLVLGLVGAVFTIVPPVEEARWGALGMAVGCGLSGALMVYLGAPGRKPETPAGMSPAKARILDASGTPGSVTGYQMIELTLEVTPKRGVPFQVKRKFSAGRLGRIEAGREIDVVYDPVNPDKLDLA